MRDSTMVWLLAVTLGAAGCASDPPEIHRWRSPIVDALDVNQDNVLDSQEIANATLALQRLDKNKDGRLTYDEIHWPKEPLTIAEPEPVVQVLDANHDDIIDSAEIANATVVLKQLDKNGDGRLTADEYT